jgi:F-box/leucine-rich repeat protein 2/20
MGAADHGRLHAHLGLGASHLMSLLLLRWSAAVQCFARCCTLLRTLRLQECKNVSDVGLLQVSNHCPALELLDISRSELAYKVTDVAMLALGERCHQLTDVNLSGCSFLTDAGIDWLVVGCHLLTTLKLPGLYKLTDTGS